MQDKYKASSIFLHNLCAKQNNDLNYDSIYLVGTQNIQECYIILKEIICKQEIFKNEKSCQGNRDFKILTEQDLRFIVFNLKM